MKINPVFRSVRFPADQQRQGEKSNRQKNHHKPETADAPDGAHEIDAEDHAHKSHAVIHHLVISQPGICVIKNQYTQRTQKVCQRKKQGVDMKASSQDMGAAPDRRRHTQRERISLPCGISKSKQKKCCAIEQHDHHGQPLAGPLTCFYSFFGFRLLFLFFLHSHPDLHPSPDRFQ